MRSTIFTEHQEKLKDKPRKDVCKIDCNDALGVIDHALCINAFILSLFDVYFYSFACTCDDTCVSVPESGLSTGGLDDPGIQI